jgi:hypothetical protein
MADYPTPNRQWLQDYVSRKESRLAADNASRTFTDFEDKVRITYDELMSLLLKKHKDYGSRNIADAPGGAINGLRVRMHDKLARINNLYDKNQSPENESLEDSFKDMANYAIIGLLVLRGEWDK